MSEKRLLIGAFDLLHVGHLAQISTVADGDVELIIGVLSDSAVTDLLGHQPLLPQEERAAVVAQLRTVGSVAIVAPESHWELPIHDSLFVDSGLFRRLVVAGVEVTNARAIVPSRQPTNAALAAATSVA
ncbi:MAG: adenylyltransferase/cytidyltransferase family protein [Candidatus Nanopelagicales bacterium]